MGKAMVLGVIAAACTWVALGVALDLYRDHLQVHLWQQQLLQQQQQPPPGVAK